MATIKYSSLVQGIKGKLNGTVAYINNHGGQLRTNSAGAGNLRCKKHKRMINADARIQNIQFGSMSQQWRELDDPQRNAWEQATQNFPTVNKFGDARTPSGFELFMRCNLPGVRTGQGLITVPPSPQLLNPILSLSAPTVLDSNITLTWVKLYATIDHLDIYASPPVSAGQKFRRGQMKIIKSFNAGTVVTYDFIDEYTALFGVPVNDCRIWFMGITTQKASGLQASPVIGTGIVGV